MGIGVITVDASVDVERKGWARTIAGMGGGEPATVCHPGSESRRRGREIERRRATAESPVAWVGRRNKTPVDEARRKELKSSRDVEKKNVCQGKNEP